MCASPLCHPLRSSKSKHWPRDYFIELVCIQTICSYQQTQDPVKIHQPIQFHYHDWPWFTACSTAGGRNLYVLTETGENDNDGIPSISSTYMPTGASLTRQAGCTLVITETLTLRAAVLINQRLQPLAPADQFFISLVRSCYWNMNTRCIVTCRCHFFHIFLQYMKWNTKNSHVSLSRCTSSLLGIVASFQLRIHIQKPTQGAKHKENSQSASFLIRSG